MLAAVAVEPIKIRRLNGARTEDCVTSGHSIEAAGSANEDASQLAVASTPLNTNKYYCSQ